MRNIFLIIIISCLLSGCKSSIVILQKETYQTEDLLMWPYLILYPSVLCLKRAQYLRFQLKIR